MAKNPGALKRQKELARLEWQAEKAAKRKKRAAEAKERARSKQGEEGSEATPVAYPTGSER